MPPHTRVGKPHPVGRIEVDEDLGFLRREWRWQRISWVLFGLIVIAALSGAFGRGPVSKRQVGETATFAVEYERVLRHGAVDQMVIHIGPALQTDTTIHLSIPQQYLADQKLEFAAPEPTQQTLENQNVILHFQRAGARTPLKIVMQVRPSGYGPVRGRVQLRGGPTLSYNQFVLP